MKYSLFFLMFSMACASGEQAEKTQTQTTVNAPSDQKSAKKKESNDKKGTSSFDPLEGRSIAEICSSNSLALIKWPYDKLASDFKALCCADGGLPEDHESCILDWPSSDVPSCGLYDEMRNEIYARYGRAFKNKKWQTLFGAKSWYKVKEDYSKTWISKTAMGNISQFKKMKREKVACVD